MNHNVPAASSPIPQPTEQTQRRAVDELLQRGPWKSEGQVQTAAGLLKYRAQAEFLPVLDASLKGVGSAPQAAVMCTSYVAAPQGPSAQRPVCFAFNGGPGSASIWLQLGALGVGVGVLAFVHI